MVEGFQQAMDALNPSGSAAALDESDATALLVAATELRRAQLNARHYDDLLRQARADYDALARRLGLPQSMLPSFQQNAALNLAQQGGSYIGQQRGAAA